MAVDSVCFVSGSEYLSTFPDVRAATLLRFGYRPGATLSLSAKFGCNHVACDPSYHQIKSVREMQRYRPLLLLAMDAGCTPMKRSRTQVFEVLPEGSVSGGEALR